MGQTTIKYGGKQGNAAPMGGADVEDERLHGPAIVVDEVTYVDAADRVYDVRGTKQFSFSITNEDGANSLTWRLQQTEDPVPESGDMTGATWVDIDAEAALAAGVTAKKEFSRITLLMAAVRLQVRETAGGSDASYIGKFVVGNYL